MYIFVIAFIILFLVRADIALDILLICVAVYYWQISLCLLAVLAILLVIMYIIIKSAEALDKTNTGKKYIAFLQSEKFKKQITEIKKDLIQTNNFLFYFFLKSIVWIIIKQLKKPLFTYRHKQTGRNLVE